MHAWDSLCFLPLMGSQRAHCLSLPSPTPYSATACSPPAKEIVTGVQHFCSGKSFKRLHAKGISWVSLQRWASLVAQLVKNPPAMWETWVRSLGWKDRLEKGKATYSSILAWRIPWTV